MGFEANESRTSKGVLLTSLMTFITQFLKYFKGIKLVHKTATEEWLPAIKSLLEPTPIPNPKRQKQEPSHNIPDTIPIPSVSDTANALSTLVDVAIERLDTTKVDFSMPSSFFALPQDMDLDSTSEMIIPSQPHQSYHPNPFLNSNSGNAMFNGWFSSLESGSSLSSISVM